MGAVLAFAPDANTERFDATRGFQPEALRFVRHHGATAASRVFFPASGDVVKRRAPIVRAINESKQPIEKLAFFCHGWRTGMQSGWDTKSITALAMLIASRCTVDAWVLLYACSTAQEGLGEAGTGGNGGFADLLRDACESAGRRVSVFAHTSRGDCTMNPYARAFRPGTGGHGGEWYIDPKDPLFPKWQRALRAEFSTLRFRAPFMTTAEIRDELSAPLSVA